MKMERTGRLPRRQGALLLAMVLVAFRQLPAGTPVLGGSAVLEQATRATLSKNGSSEARFASSSASAVLDWSKLDVPQGKTLGFDGGGTTFFNLVAASAGKSQIDGIVNGSGSVWVVNPSGVAFGANAVVNVGGLFGVAAGNLANESAIRDGSSLVPSFSSFGGRVEVDGGAKFTADQVALLGKGVSAAGDFTGTKSLLIAGSDRMVVDEVEGGRISVSLGDFAQADGDVLLGDLLVDGALAVKSAGALASAPSAETGNGPRLAAVRTGSRIQAGDISFETYDDLVVNGKLKSTAGSVSLLAVGDLDVNAEVDALGDVSAVSAGDVIVSADVTARTGGVGIYSYGNVVVDEGAAVKAAGTVDIEAGVTDGAEGNVRIDGSVVSSGGDVRIYSAYGQGACGDINVSGSLSANVVQLATGIQGDGSRGDISVSGEISAAGASAAVLAYAGYGRDAQGDVTVSGTVQVDGARGVLRVASGIGDASSGSVAVTETGRLAVHGENALIGIETGDGENARGDVNIAGTISVKGMGGSVAVSTGVGDGASGNVNLSGTVEAENVQLITGSGRGSSGDIVLPGTVVVDGDGGGIHLSSAYGENAQGDVDVSGMLSVRGTDGRIVVLSGHSDGARGDVTVSGTMQIEGERGQLAVCAGGGGEGGVDGSSGSVNILQSGRLVARGDESRVAVESGLAESWEGDVNIAGTVLANGVDCLVQVATGAGKGSRGDVKVSGTVQVDGARGVVSIYAGHETGSSGSADVQKSGRVLAKGEGSRIDIRSGYVDNAQGDVNISGTVAANDENCQIMIAVGDGTAASGDANISGTVEANGENGWVRVFSAYGDESRGDIHQAGLLSADGQAGLVVLQTGYGEGARGDIEVEGAISANGDGGSIQAYAGVGDRSKGSIRVGDNARWSADGKDGTMVLAAGMGRTTAGDIQMDGVATAEGKGGRVLIAASHGDGSVGDIAMAGSVRAEEEAQLRACNGDVAVSGNLSAVGSAGHAAVWADGNGRSSGRIFIQGTGGISAGDTVTLVARGDVAQEGYVAPLSRGGCANAEDLTAAISADRINMSVGGSCKGLVVRGKIYGVISGDAWIAASSGANFVGGTAEDAPTQGLVSGVKASLATLDSNDEIHTLEMKLPDLTANFSGLGGTAALVVGGDLSIYTAGKLEPNGLLQAGGDITVSAGAFGDLSYLRAGGTLYVNNVGRPSHPLLAYFETVNGVTPKIANQPNDVVVFIDGRLAGGNIQTMNRLGSVEAFPVETPELKSVQGVFGNPNFIHGDLDVSEPVGIGVVDYLLVDRARMSYGADIPPEMDMQVSVNGLSPLYSYWFGQHAAKRAGAGRGPRGGVAASD